MKRTYCPICAATVVEFRRVAPDLYELSPCGHGIEEADLLQVIGMPREEWERQCREAADKAMGLTQE